MNFKEKYRAEMQQIRPDAHLIAATGQKLAAKKQNAAKTKRLKNSALVLACLTLALSLPFLGQPQTPEQPVNQRSADGPALLFAPAAGESDGESTTDGLCALPTLSGRAMLNADCSPNQPETVITLTAEEVTNMTACAAYLPPHLPEDMQLETATLHLSPGVPDTAALSDTNAPLGTLLLNYTDGAYNYLTLRISPYTAANEPRLAEADRPETWDESLYGLPFSETIPSDMWQQVTDPIFPAEDFTAEILQQLAGDSDQNAKYVRFGLKAGDMLLEYTAHTPDIDGVWQAVSETPGLK